MLIVDYAQRNGIQWGYSPAAEMVAEMTDLLASGGEITRRQFIDVSLRAQEATDALFNALYPYEPDPWLPAWLMEAFAGQSLAEEA